MTSPYRPTPKTAGAALAALMLIAAAPGPAAEADLSAMDVVRRANYVSYYQADDGRADVNMTITDSQGRTRNRQMTILRRDQRDPDAAEGKAGEPKDVDLAKGVPFCGEQKFYVYFHRPADVNKMAFLVWKHPGADDDRWLYVPGLDLVKRISSADKRTSFVGSHFFYEDVSGRGIHADEHELVETSKTYYVLKSTPKKPDLVEFAGYKTWVHRTTFIVVQQEYVDDTGRTIRKYKAEAMKKVQGNWTVTKSRMTDLRTKGHTVLEYDDIQYGADLPEDIFTERYLRRPPRQHLK